MLHKRQEVPVGVQQRKPILDATCRDKRVDGLANRISLASEQPEDPGRLDEQIVATKVYVFERVVTLESTRITGPSLDIWVEKTL